MTFGKPEDGAKEAGKIVDAHWDKLNQPTNRAFDVIKNLDEEGNADEALRKLEGIIINIIEDEEFNDLIDSISKKFGDSLLSEDDEKRKKALKKLQRLFLDRYAL